MELDQAAIDRFRTEVWAYFEAHRRDMPWRRPEANGSFDPYKILVSELMLQQTQVPRVIPKFQQFVAVFPDIRALASAPLADVLRLWSGLGYNRRAKFLWQAARAVEHDFDGLLPQTLKELKQLPGVGANTGGAILAYAFNQPVVFIETNIRTVYIHHFFIGKDDVPDTALLGLIGQTLPPDNPREWYWALMDYGAHLKSSVGNLNRHSRQYARQSPLEGSVRQIRGRVLKLLGEGPHSRTRLAAIIRDDRLSTVLEDLRREGLIHHHAGRLYLGS